MYAVSSSQFPRCGQIPVGGMNQSSALPEWKCLTVHDSGVFEGYLPAPGIERPGNRAQYPALHQGESARNQAESGVEKVDAGRGEGPTRSPSANSHAPPNGP